MRDVTSVAATHPRRPEVLQHKAEIAPRRRWRTAGRMIRDAGSQEAFAGTICR